MRLSTCAICFLLATAQGVVCSTARAGGGRKAAVAVAVGLAAGLAAGQVRRHLTMSRWKRQSRKPPAGPVMRRRGDIVVASHNIMYGEQLDRLLPRYAALRSERGLDMMLVQEDAGGKGAVRHSERIAASLGRSYARISSAKGRGRGEGDGELAIVYDRTRLECLSSKTIDLPRLDALSRLEKAFTRNGGKPETKQAMIAVFRPAAGGRPFTVVNFHLDAAGKTRHRARQAKAIASELRRSHLTDRLVIGGDTNAFAAGHKRQRAALHRIVGALSALGTSDKAEAPTHLFGRMNEPKATHQLTRAAALLLGDMPGRYDVLQVKGLRGPTGTAAGSSLSSLWETDNGSDHALVYRVIRP